jgi:large subunit ribosomal protein L13
MRSLIDRLVSARIGRTTNFYREGRGAAVRRDRLAAYLEARVEAPILLVGEAPGYRGARISGLPFTSERQLTGAGPAEATATIVQRVLAELGLAEERRPDAPRDGRLEPAADRAGGGRRPRLRRGARPRPPRGRRRPDRRGRSGSRIRTASFSRRRRRVSRRDATIRARRTPCPPFLHMKTYSAKPGEIQRDWLVVDAEGKTLGRLATVIADRLRGKNKATFTPHVDTGDFVVVVNAEKITVTGKKLDEKMYYKHSGYPGGLRERTLREQLDRQPTEVIRKAVKGMLPRNKLGRAQLTKLKIYAGPEHPHEAQAPTPLEV